MIQDPTPPPRADSLLSVRGLVKHFPVTKGVVFKRRVGTVHAVDGIDLDVDEGKTLGLVGESGCGKSTTARMILRLLDPTAGEISFMGRDITFIGQKELREVRRDMQIVFQDPYASLNPRMTVREIVGEPMRVNGMSRSDAHRRVNYLLEQVGLDPAHAKRYPHEFSGGQRQRIGVARALSLSPKLIVCDEPVSALDVSIQAQIINLLEDIQDQFQVAYLFIAHDLSVVRHISDRVAVMYLGKIMETAERKALYEQPLHPYTQGLLSAVPVPDPDKERTRHRILLKGDVPSPMNPPSGCRFHTRCHRAREVADAGGISTVEVGAAKAPVPRVCVEEEPRLEAHGPNHLAACHFAERRAVV